MGEVNLEGGGGGQAGAAEYRLHQPIGSTSLNYGLFGRCERSLPPVSGIGWLEMGAGVKGASEYPSLDCDSF